MVLRQYTIVLVNLDPTIGSEIRKTRPCVIISPDEMNKHLRTVVIAPMTASQKDYPTRVSVRHNGIGGNIAMDQIRTIDKKRIVRAFEILSPSEISDCKAVLKETFVD
jgi:mRNA interferase MazF